MAGLCAPTAHPCILRALADVADAGWCRVVTSHARPVSRPHLRARQREPRPACSLHLSPTATPSPSPPPPGLLCHAPVFSRWDALTRWRRCWLCSYVQRESQAGLHRLQDRPRRCPSGRAVLPLNRRRCLRPAPFALAKRSPAQRLPGKVSPAAMPSGSPPLSPNPQPTSAHSNSLFTPCPLPCATNDLTHAHRALWQVRLRGSLQNTVS